MPRGIPNAKKDDFGMRYTTFHVPLTANPKLTASGYPKNESRPLWARNALNAPEDAAGAGGVSEGLVGGGGGRRGTRVLVIHPGSRWLRIGRASDVAPVAVPHVIARRVWQQQQQQQQQQPATPPEFVQNIARPWSRGGGSLVENAKGGVGESSAGVAGGAGDAADDEYAVRVLSDDVVEGKIAAIHTSLRDRMRFYKLRVTPNAAKIAASFNEQMQGEESVDPLAACQAPPKDEILVGERVYELSDEAHLEGYAIKWPTYAGRFNRRDYKSHQHTLSDIEEIWRTVIREELEIEPRFFNEYSVVLVIPDLWDRFYVQELVNMLLISMGFKQIVCQQESLAATYGAGISNACVVDLGATRTSIACVDDGLVIQDTRMLLAVGGDNITEFLWVLLDRISFPYREMDLARMHDWLVMEDLKHRICTLIEVDVRSNLYDFWVRKPRKNPVKYGLRAYDEVILAPMILFEPRVVEFDKKRDILQPGYNSSLTDEILEFVQDHVTHAMMISTQHLMPQASHPSHPPQSIPASGAATPQREGSATSNAQKEPSKKPDGQTDATDVDVVDIDMTDKPEERTQESQPSASEPVMKSETGAAASSASTTGAQVSTDNTLALTTPAPTQSSEAAPIATQQTFIGGYPIDVPFEASKLPLDVAIYNSARAAGGDERIRKYLQVVLIVGGGSLMQGMAHALESRLQAIATPLVPNMDKVQIIPPPKDVDPRMLAWKGAAVLGKMEAVSDLWLTASDWQQLGMRGLKERCFFL